MPTHAEAGLGVPVVLEIEGLGPPRAAVFDPMGARVTVDEAPLSRDGAIVGTAARFLPRVVGRYRVEQAEALGQPLALVDVR